MAYVSIIGQEINMGTVLDGLRSQRDAAIQQLSNLRQTLKDFDTAIAALEGKVDGIRPSVKRQTGRPTLKEAVLLVIGAGQLTTDEILSAVNATYQLGTSKPSMASTLSRLKADGDVAKSTDNEKWVIPTKQTSAGTTVSADVESNDDDERANNQMSSSYGEDLRSSTASSPSYQPK
jgi:hypothetical protein